MTAQNVLGISPAARAKILIEEMNRWLGIHEVGGNNKGQLVELFLKGSGLGSGYAWCMACVQYSAAAVDRIARIIDPTAPAMKMAKGAGCLNVWNMTPVANRRSKPEVGAVIIWRHGTTSQGHTGVVTEVLPNGSFKTIEGNTGPASGVNRDGDGVFAKTHTLAPSGDMRVVGFILPWG